ncbi:hypothetical protein FCV25MIE_28905, partial [Fagus crenata]
GLRVAIQDRVSLQVIFSVTELERTTTRNQVPNRSSFDSLSIASNRGKAPVTSQPPAVTSGSVPSTSIAPTIANTTRKDTT